MTQNLFILFPRALNLSVRVVSWYSILSLSGTLKGAYYLVNVPLKQSISAGQGKFVSLSKSPTYPGS